MEKRHVGKVYISGQVNGMEYELICARFVDAEIHLERKGYDTVSPVRVCHASWNFRKWMSACMKELVDCDAIYMLKGWKKSREAKLEHFIALKLGIRVMLE